MGCAYTGRELFGTVYLDAYSIGEHEVTAGQYRNFCKETGRTMPPAPRWDGTRRLGEYAW